MPDTQLDAPEGTPIPPVALSRRRWFLPVLCGVTGFLLGIAVVGGSIGISSAVTAAHHKAAVAADEKKERSIFMRALSKCDLSNDGYSQIADGGYTLTIDNQGDDDIYGISYDDLTCIEAALHTPAAVVSHIGQTTSMDGRQEESWGRITMAWSYHPDRGLDGVYTLKK
jgi:hypothetical protein